MRYFIHFAYNGANYNGYQTQPGLPTVQLTIEQALSTLLRTPIAIVGCGRTDTGVHASDYYAHFDYPKKYSNPAIDEACIVPHEESMPVPAPINLQQLVFKLNSFLPADLAIFDIFPVKENAHARFDAISRTYQYHVSDLRLPFKQGLYSRIYFHPDMDLMNQGAAILMEYDDFTSFAKLHTDVKTNICHITHAHWDKVDDEWIFTIRSNRFLRNMVRSVTGTLLDVGRGKLSLDGLRQIIEKKDRCAAGVSMPPQGLFLMKVEYPFDQLRIDQQQQS
ncbi:MAG: tRNA pseudouridine(38-40) synthase TruA [Bacteroidales bacterium]|nr:tRNA pseudouridine(38-40) synthase TruA [Bacteroidales bacterium]